jgi:hypothetical protein
MGRRGCGAGLPLFVAVSVYTGALTFPPMNIPKTFVDFIPVKKKSFPCCKNKCHAVEKHRESGENL